MFTRKEVCIYMTLMFVILNGMFYVMYQTGTAASYTEGVNDAFKFIKLQQESKKSSDKSKPSGDVTITI